MNPSFKTIGLDGYAYTVPAGDHFDDNRAALLRGERPKYAPVGCEPMPTVASWCVFSVVSTNGTTAAIMQSLHLGLSQNAAALEAGKQPFNYPVIMCPDPASAMRAMTEWRAALREAKRERESKKEKQDG